MAPAGCPAGRRLAAAVLALTQAGGLLLAAGGPAHAEASHCGARQVEFLVGGAGKRSGVTRSCEDATGATAPARPAAASAARPASVVSPGAGAPTTARPVATNESDRRDILERELRRERSRLADLDRLRASADPRAASAMDEQRHRHQSDIAALERELAQTPGR